MSLCDKTNVVLYLMQHWDCLSVEMSLVCPDLILIFELQDIQILMSVSVLDNICV